MTSIPTPRTSPRAAVADLDELVRTHSLPLDTRQRVRGVLEPLQQFPRLGSELAGRWERFRFILGPWRWMLLFHVFDEDRDRVVVVTVQDARTRSVDAPLSPLRRCRQS